MTYDSTLTPAAPVTDATHRSPAMPNPRGRAAAGAAGAATPTGSSLFRFT